MKSYLNKSLLKNWMKLNPDRFNVAWNVTFAVSKNNFQLFNKHIGWRELKRLVSVKFNCEREIYCLTSFNNNSDFFLSDITGYYDSTTDVWSLKFIFFSIDFVTFAFSSQIFYLINVDFYVINGWICKPRFIWVTKTKTGIFWLLIYLMCRLVS